VLEHWNSWSKIYFLYGDFLKWGGTNLSYRFPIFETSATALCGTTGKLSFFGHLHLGTPPYLLIRFWSTLRGGQIFKWGYRQEACIS
jgi:hypothetical protein